MNTTLVPPHEDFLYATVSASSLHGHYTLPPSKSHTMRALFLASLASGRSYLSNLLSSPDTTAMVQALSFLGVRFTYTKSFTDAYGFDVIVDGIGGDISLLPDNSICIDAGNSGQVMRFLTPLFALQGSTIKFTGDESLQSLRPMGSLLQALTKIGAGITYSRKEGFAPFTIKGPLQAGNVYVNGPDSQPVSALLLTLPFLSQGTSVVYVDNLGEKPWVEFTLWWLRRVGIYIDRPEPHIFIIPGKQKIKPFSYTIPADASSLAFPLTIALLTTSDLTLHDVDMSDPQGDIRIISILESMGAAFKYEEKDKTLRVIGPQLLQGQEVDMDGIIDGIPIISVCSACCMPSSHTRLYNAASARTKESDRIQAISSILEQFGVDTKQQYDQLIIKCSDQHLLHIPSKTLHTYSDHRIAMAAATLAAVTKNNERGICIGPINCIKKSFPNFFESLQKIGLHYSYSNTPR